MIIYCAEAGFNCLLKCLYLISSPETALDRIQMRLLISAVLPMGNNVHSQVNIAKKINLSCFE